MKDNSQAGQVNPLLISNIIVAVLAVTFAGVAVWAYMNYMDQKDNTQDKIDKAVTTAVKAKGEEDEKNYQEREKLPTRTFQGPADLGAVTFQYPKTWSTYVAKNTGALEAYLNPDVVPSVSTTQPFAVRVLIEDKTYDTVIKTYDELVKKGDLRSNPTTISGFSGIRLDGKFSKSREGSAVIFKVRDKTLTLASDSTTFKGDFDNTVLSSLKFNP